jgi:DNA primase
MRVEMSTNSSYSLKSIEEEILSLFDKYNISIQSASGEELNVYCPFHKNTHSAAMYINVRTGLWQCFNPSCGKKGNFRQLYFNLTGKNYSKNVINENYNLEKQLNNYLHKIEDVEELSIDNLSIDYSNQINLLQTMLERGLTVETLKHFEVGFSTEKNRVVIPVRSHNYKLVGLIGRAVDSSQQPRYLYNKGFKRADVLFNIHNAKAHSSVIITEGSVDCMFVHQAGFPNVVATLGAAVSKTQGDMIKRFFDKIILFCDNDEAGVAMRYAMIEMCRGKEISVANISDGLKDPAEMNKEQIINAINNKQIII